MCVKELYFNKAKNRWYIVCRDKSLHAYARAVVETELKRSLFRNERVYHIDGDTTNDEISNLKVSIFTINSNKNNGYCECECGQITTIAKRTGDGIRKGEHKRFISGHNRKGKGQKDFYFHQGRWLVTLRDWKKKGEPWARVVMRNHIGRELLPGEVVHHVNEDSSDDRIENLKLYSSQK